MMIDLLRSRHSVRKFENRPIERDKIDLLCEGLLRSPSSRGRNPWEFVIVQERAVLEKLSRAKMSGSELIAGSALSIVILGDEAKADTWVEDCSIAAIIIQLLAVDLGLGSCWVQIRNRPHNGSKSAEEYVRDLLGIPAQKRVGMIIAAGYSAEEPCTESRIESDTGRIHYEHY